MNSVALVLLAFAAVACSSGPAHRPPLPYTTTAAADGVLATAKHDLGAAPARLWGDTKSVFSDGDNLLLLAGATAYTIAQESFWEDNEEEFFEHHTLFGGTVQDVLGALGNGLTLYAGALTWYFVALANDRTASYEASKTVLSAMTVTAATALLMKATVSDGRPNGGSHDFPSGHASLTMAAASALDGLYGHGVGIPAYVLSGLVGLQRLDTRKHDTGAVFFGWVLGYVVGRTVAEKAAPRVLGLQVGLCRDPDSGSYGVSLFGGL